MHKIKLTTLDGQQVRDAEIPPFVRPPEVITWGARVFHRNDSDMLEIAPDGVWVFIYREAFAYALVS